MKKLWALSCVLFISLGLMPDAFANDGRGHGHRHYGHHRHYENHGHHHLQPGLHHGRKEGWHGAGMHPRVVKKIH